MNIKKYYNYFLCVLISMIFCSCSGSNTQTKTNTYEIDVPYEEQCETKFCLPASVLMCSEYFARDVGWYNDSINDFDSPSKQNFIYQFLINHGGITFYTDSSNGAPKAISKFLYNYLNIRNKEMACLQSTYFFIDSLDLIKQEIQFSKKPLIAIVNENDEKTHAVVITGFQESVTSGECTKIFYNDPYYGIRNKSKSEWDKYTYLSADRYLTLYFGSY